MEVLVKVLSSTASRAVYMKLTADIISKIPTKYLLGIRDFNIEYPVIYAENELPSQYMLANASSSRLTFNNCTASFLYWHKNREITCKLEPVDKEEDMPF